MMGATHSEDGMVMQRGEDNVAIVSLVDHTPDDVNWGPSLDKVNAKVRLTAGMSWYDAIQLFRAQGFVLNTRTPGRGFSVGGVIANMVHGGGSQYGFIHDEVTRMLVMISDGTVMEVDGEELQYWRSSGGQLGVILSVEMMLHSESNPYVVGINSTTYQPIFDETKGGLNMKRKTTSFASLLPTAPGAPNAAQVFALIQGVTQEVFTTVATSDHQQFFYNWYLNELSSYYTDYSEARFSGADGPYPNQLKAIQYQRSADGYVAAFPDAAYDGADKLDLFTGDQGLCDILCVPPTGPPPLGDGSVCEPIQSQTDPSKLLCEVQVEAAAAFTTISIQSIDSTWDLSKSTVNDGSFLVAQPEYDALILMAPSRVFPNAFLTWWATHGLAVSGDPNLGFSHADTAPLEIRFIKPTETAKMNPVPTFDDWKTEFDTKYQLIPNAFDTYFPQIQGVPDGIMAMEVPNVKGIFDENLDKWFVTMQNVWENMPVIPSVQYGPNPVPNQAFISPDCNPPDVLPCVPSTTVQGTYTEPMGSSSGICCIPKIPAKIVHFGKGWYVELF